MELRRARLPSPIRRDGDGDGGNFARLLLPSTVCPLRFLPYYFLLLLLFLHVVFSFRYSNITTAFTHAFKRWLLSPCWGSLVRFVSCALQSVRLLPYMPIAYCLGINLHFPAVTRFRLISTHAFSAQKRPD